MTEDDYDAQWRCKVCGKWWVVPGLARDCEAKHDSVTTPPAPAEE